MATIRRTRQARNPRPPVPAPQRPRLFAPIVTARSRAAPSGAAFATGGYGALSATGSPCLIRYLRPSASDTASDLLPGRIGSPVVDDAVSAFFAGDHRHDWRVDPSQVIIMLGNSARIRLGCVGCEATALVTTTPSPTPRPHNRATWRPYRYKQGDSLRVELPE